MKLPSSKRDIKLRDIKKRGFKLHMLMHIL